MTNELNNLLDDILRPKTLVNGLPVEVHATPAAHHTKAVRTASRISRLMRAEQTNEVRVSLDQHKATLADLGFKAPNTLRECIDLIEKLGA